MCRNAIILRMCEMIRSLNFGSFRFRKWTASSVGSSVRFHVKAATRYGVVWKMRLPQLFLFLFCFFLFTYSPFFADLTSLKNAPVKQWIKLMHYETRFENNNKKWRPIILFHLLIYCQNFNLPSLIRNYLLWNKIEKMCNFGCSLLWFFLFNRFQPVWRFTARF